MTTISINLSTNDLLKGVEQLEKEALEDFVKKVLQIRAKRLADALSKEETTLLEAINIGLSEQEQFTLQQLADKSQEGQLTEIEHQYYMTLVEKLEEFNNKRLIALGKLSQLRGVALQYLKKHLSTVIICLMLLISYC